MSDPDPDPKSVFLNVPFDPSYQPFFVTLVSALVCLGQTPRCVLEVKETGNGRLARILGLLRSCKVSIHDLSRNGQPARFNMPFELGLACALGLTTGKYEIVVMDTRRYRLDVTLSDYKGRDPVIYNGRLNDLVDGIADVFQVAKEPEPGVLKAEARLLRRSAEEIARQYGGTVFRAKAFRTLVAAASARARAAGFISA